MSKWRRWPMPSGIVCLLKDEMCAAYRNEPSSLDPNYHSSRFGAAVMRNIFDPLIAIDDDGSLKPALAESWEGSDDGMSITFKLRKGVKFHGGMMRAPCSRPSIACWASPCKKYVPLAGESTLACAPCRPPMLVIGQYFGGLCRRPSRRHIDLQPPSFLQCDIRQLLRWERRTSL